MSRGCSASIPSSSLLVCYSVISYSFCIFFLFPVMIGRIYHVVLGTFVFIFLPLIRAFLILFWITSLESCFTYYLSFAMDYHILPLSFTSHIFFSSLSILFFLVWWQSLFVPSCYHLFLVMSVCTHLYYLMEELWLFVYLFVALFFLSHCCCHRPACCLKNSWQDHLYFLKKHNHLSPLNTFFPVVSMSPWSMSNLYPTLFELILPTAIICIFWCMV